MAPRASRSTASWSRRSRTASERGSRRPSRRTPHCARAAARRPADKRACDAAGERIGCAQDADLFTSRTTMARVVSLTDAVAELVHDGDSVALEGFTHLIPFAAGHELLRQGRRELELIRMTPDVLYDQMIGMGAARRLVFSYGGNPGVGSLHRFRDAIENGWPSPIELEEHSHAGMANRYVAGAARLPFAVMRGYAGTDLRALTRVAAVTCPFTGEELTAVPALRPDVAIIHAQEADREATSSCGGSRACRRRRCSVRTARWSRSS